MKTKPWIIAGIQNYTKIKNKVFKYYISKKDITLKNECKKYRICSQHLFKNCCAKFFKNKFNILKNIWKGIRNLISMSKLELFLPPLLSQNNESITNPINIHLKHLNIFNNFFSDIA